MEAAQASELDSLKQNPTPVMRQYLDLKAQVPDAILLFRLGDFYEMFFEDAIDASAVLDIALTSRSKGDERIPMCGVPHHSARGYIARLVAAGRKVALCEQIDDGARMMRREITRILTPGMVIEDELLDPLQSHRLAAIAGEGDALGVAFLDLSTGSLQAAAVGGADALNEELWRHAPSEVLRLPGLPPGLVLDALPTSGVPLPMQEAAELPAGEVAARLQGLHIEGTLGPAPARAVAALLRYAEETQRRKPSHVDRVQVYRPSEQLSLDEASRRNLEVTRTLRDGAREGSLLWAMDQTSTAMGARLLTDWLLAPLTDLRAIAARHDTVEELFEKPLLRQQLRGILRQVRDLERLSGRLALGQGNPREMRALGSSLLQLPGLQKALGSCHATRLGYLAGRLDGLQELAATIDQALAADPPVQIKDGGLFRQGHHPQLDELTALARDGRSTLASLEGKERLRTGIGSLKVRYNKVFGYFIEVTSPNLKLVPPDYVRRQTTVGGERFVTEELKQFEEKVLGADERRLALEARLYEELRLLACAELPKLRNAATALAELDVLLSFALVASEHRYVRPLLDDSDVLEIEEGRHAVVERMLTGGAFVPNDLRLDRESCQLLILTGPNMAGKSTVLRQLALTVLLAQAGSFVPARRARIGRCDRIFTRVGASDNLSRGQSTFMVEMTETAQILAQATPRSLVILDEIGRGTSTFDGLSIAWAVAEQLHDQVGARTVFATHYHELTDLSRDRPRVRNASMLVREVGGKVVFLRKLIEGGTSRSYGIEVARLAGLPAVVVERAKEILANLESGELDETGRPLFARAKRATGRAGAAPQLALFQPPAGSALERELAAVDLSALTPLQALNLLAEWQAKIARATKTS
jgi:DNA mismatch repair protein MutS